jgi:hypothetical protein
VAKVAADKEREHVAKVDVKEARALKRPVKMPDNAPHYDDGHRDFEENSSVLYDNSELEGPNWLVGEVIGVDHISPMLNVHRHGSMGLREGKEIEECSFKPAYIDPKDGLQVHTTRPLHRYQPILDNTS